MTITIKFPVVYSKTVLLLQNYLLRPCKVQQPTANCFLSVAITPVKDVIRLVGMGYCTLHIALCIVALGATDMTGSVYEEWGINTIQVTTEGM